MVPFSLKWRIGLCLVVLLLVVISTVSVVAYIELNKSLLRVTDRRLCSDIETIVAVLESEDSSGDARAEIDAFLNPRTASDATVYGVWFENDGGYFASNQAFVKWATTGLAGRKRMPTSGEYELFAVQIENEYYRVAWARPPIRRSPLLPSQQPVNIVVGVPSSHVISEMQEFLEALLVVAGITILSSLLMASLILRWGLKPIAALITRMNDISGTHMRRSGIETLKLPAELNPFVRAWDHMLQRLAHAMEQQRRFTADASHELRTPLAVAKSTLQTVRSRQRTPAAYEFAIDESLEDLDRLEHLIGQLLALARVDDIATQTRWKTIELGDLVADVCEQHRLIAERSSIALRWEVRPVVVKGDDEQLRILLSSLVDNAVKYGPRGSEVVVSMQREERSVRVTVHDEGANITELEQERIFDRFYRMRATSQSGATGSGLGLALAREIAHKHLGEISLTCDRGRGTDFIVILPVL
jgi:heavy metal sensor kinase